MDEELTPPAESPIEVRDIPQEHIEEAQRLHDLGNEQLIAAIQAGQVPGVKPGSKQAKAMLAAIAGNKGPVELAAIEAKESEAIENANA